MKRILTPQIDNVRMRWIDNIYSSYSLQLILISTFSSITKNKFVPLMRNRHWLSMEHIYIYIMWYKDILWRSIGLHFVTSIKLYVTHLLIKWLPSTQLYFFYSHKIVLLLEQHQKKKTKRKKYNGLDRDLNPGPLASW